MLSGDMGSRNFLLVAIIVLSGGFANGFHSISFSSNSGRFVQWVFADNTINNQTSTSNINCDSTSSCITNPSQRSFIGGGDENKIDQLIDLQNNHCTGSSTCDLTGNEQASISQSNEGEIFDGGTGNVNTQTSHSDADSNNVNKIFQRQSELNKQCDGKSNCSGEAVAQASVGKSFGGFIFSFGNDSKNTETILKSKSSNDNSLSQNDNQHIEGCPGTDCSNFVSNIQGLSTAFSGIIFDGG